MNDREIIREFVLAYVKDDSLEDDENMFELGYVNSLFAMQLVMFVEKKFEMTISREQLRLDNFRSIEAIAELVERQRSVAS
ncbi:MAG: phosphopantetheine-binding protein [Deltaproteobacteria bacterium]|jgi:acyl carrier protein|nr:phosphopantetheine-binding protein [Deltaproteobacteria bacterium]